MHSSIRQSIVSWWDLALLQMEWRILGNACMRQAIAMVDFLLDVRLDYRVCIVLPIPFSLQVSRFARGHVCSRTQ